MKRILICSALFLGALAASCYSYFIVEQLDEELNLRIEILMSALHEENAEAVIEQSNDLVVFWQEREKILVRYVRHSHIDVISISMARLPALAQYGDYGEVHAELFSILRQMQQIRDAELITLSNLL